MIAAFDNARPLDEPLSPDEVAALEEAMADQELGISSRELRVARSSPREDAEATSMGARRVFAALVEREPLR